MRQALRIRHFAPPGGRPAPAVRPVCGDLIEVDVDRPHRWHRHQHPDYEALLIIRGTYRCLIGEERLAVGPGRLLLVKPGDSHVDLLEPPLRYVALQFELVGGRGAGPAVFAEGARASDQIIVPDAETRAIFARLREISRDASAACAGIRDGLVGEFFWRVVRAVPAQALARPFRPVADDEGFSARLAERLDAAVDQPLGVPELAAGMGMTPSALTHRCRAAIGISPARALRNRRLDHARAVLERTGASIKEVASSLGFSDQFHFSRAFRQRHGFPPSRLRAGVA